MSPAFALISPTVFKKILEKYGFRLELETDSNWTLFNEDAARPIITIPKKGKFVSLDIMMEILDQLKIDNVTYFRLLDRDNN